MFRHRHPLRGLHGLHALNGLLAAAHHVGAQAQHIGSRAPWGLVAARRARHRTPSLAHIVLAGAVVLAFVTLLSQAQKPGRSRFSRIALGALVLVVGAIAVSLRRSGRRYRL